MCTVPNAEGRWIGMIDQEKVISNLQILREWVEVHPYYHKRLTYSEARKAMDWLDDALALLKEQEPRVLAPSEAYTADFMYVEFDGVITPALRTSNEREGHRESYFAMQQLGGEWMRWDDYGKTWRVWSARPTDEQRKAVEWDD